MNDQSVRIAVMAQRTYRQRLVTLVKKTWWQLQRWWQLAEQRRKLALLDDRALHDLGLSRADALQESERPFWDDPLAK